MNDHAEVNTEENPTHLVRFPPDKLPGGRLIRGTYPAHSKFYEEGPVVSWCSDSGITPLREVKPTVGLKPTIPFNTDGDIILPSVSVPNENIIILAAVLPPLPVELHRLS
ncbi:hypothetical protein QCA50_010012 [Cerrena zonata]|uniref:Uncharacterized protein n=1 Tax=Cerrena zonata TaxID=2478898 RepID=A0AAW0FZK2_9APHY